MSMSAMANAAMGRREDFPPVGRVPRGIQELASAATSAGKPANVTTAALDVIVTYIPTEILTLYVSVTATLRAPESPSRGLETAFWGFLVATPIVIWILYATKVRIAGKGLPIAPSTWPVWEMTAGMIAYAVWALALPDNPVAASLGYPPPLAGVAVLITAAALGLLAPLFQRPLKTT
jgi:hypothetical protein